MITNVLPADPENQRGRHLAKKYDPNGDRTIRKQKAYCAYNH